MRAISYYLLLPLIYLLSLLPFPILYLLSDFVYVVVYYVMGYRKEVVIKNLKNSFPSKSDAEIKTITKNFYRYVCDLFLETFKTLTIRRSTMLKHCYLDANAQKLFDKLADEHKSIIIVMGHQGNWEWAGNSFSLNCRHQLYIIYHPLANPYFNRLMYNMRTRFANRLIAMKDTIRDMMKNRNELNATAFIADQSPNPQNSHWMDFLHQDTPVFKGTAKIAQKLKYPVVYVSVKKIKRGYYELKAEELIPDTNNENSITEIFMKKLEQDIIEQPETWLWSHRRWKHKRTSQQPSDSVLSSSG